MTNKSSIIAKGVGIAMAVGSATALIGSSMMGSSNRKMKKSMNKAVKAVENIVGGINSAMK